MSDPMMQTPPMPQQPTMGAPQQQPGMGSNVEKNLSVFNPKDMILMLKTMANDPQATVRDFLSRIGIDADGPVAQITQWIQKGMENATPLGQMKNMGGGPPAGSGMPPAEPEMPGRKPMVQPPGAPTAGGMEGLLGKLGR